MGYIEQQKERIIQELLESNKIKTGQSIDYKYFLKLYKPYKNLMREIDFAETLGINYFNHHSLKNRGTMATVLRSLKNTVNTKRKTTKEEKERILEELLESNKIKEGQIIDYKYFLSLYEPYKTRIKEVEFAEELSIPYQSYLSMKNQGKRASVLKNGKEKAWKNESIIEELLNEGKIKPGQSISYEYFLEIYQLYKEQISEVDYAKLLEINYSTHNKMKNGKIKRVKILKNRAEKEVEEQKDNILENLIRENKVQLGELIDYEKFLRLYEAYVTKMTEKDFAKVLGIPEYCYKSIRNIKGTKTKVLGNNKQIDKEEKEEIIRVLLREKIELGQLITYEEFLQLYEEYKVKMQEKDFAKILGISDCCYKNMKNVKEYKTRVLCDKAEVINTISYLLEKKSRYYSKEQIAKLSQTYEIDIDTLIQYVICKGKERNVSSCMKVLEEKGKLWIGKTKCTKRFASKYAKTIIEESKRLSRKICLKYECTYIEQDLASDAIEYILQECGDVERNFQDDENEVVGIIGARIYAFIKNKCLTNTVRQKKMFFYKNKGSVLKRKRKDFFDTEIEDRTQGKIQDEVVEKMALKEKRKKENVSSEEKTVELLMESVELGLSREEALLRTGEMLGINPEEMLETLQNYMIKQNKVRQTQEGEYILGE